jgi:hypothetical protein
MWSDNETSEDLIGFQVHADLVREVLSAPQMLPLTIGVFGDWGGGKTSIMKMLERDLDPETYPEGSAERLRYENLAVIYFNGWLFEGYDDAKSAILSSVLLSLGEHKRFGPKIRDGAINLLKSVNWMRAAKFGAKHVALPALLAAATGGVAAIPMALGASIGLSSLGKGEEAKDKKDSPEEAWIKVKDSEHAMDVRTFRERFAKLLLDSDIKTLVVLIDDLDRCNPERVIENLEAIKLFLSVPSTAFVIGADPRIVEHAIRQRYAERAADGGSEEDTERLVRDYLEKVVQIPYQLPRLSGAEIETYMVLLFCKLHLETDKAAACITRSKSDRSENRYGAFGYAKVREALGGGELDGTLASALTFCASAAPLIADGLEGNPRQVKRFLNAFILRRKLAQIAKLSNILDEVLVKLMILEYTNDALFKEVFSWQSLQSGFPEELARLEKGASDGKTSYEEAGKGLNSAWLTKASRQWIAMEPALAHVDLRDYFWIARDRLESSFAGLSMVSPLVRTVLNNLLSGTAPLRQAGLTAAAALSEQELETLYEFLEQAILRHPDDKKGYDAMRGLTEKKIIAAGQRYNEILIKVPLDNAHPSVGVDIRTLVTQRPELQATFESSLKRLESSSAKVGAAMKVTKGPKN